MCRCVGGRVDGNLPMKTETEEEEGRGRKHRLSPQNRQPETGWYEGGCILEPPGVKWFWKYSPLLHTYVRLKKIVPENLKMS